MINQKEKELRGIVLTNEALLIEVRKHLDKLQLMQSAEKVNRLEEKLYETNNEKLALSKLVKALENKERQQGWELSRLDAETANMGKMTNLVDDLRVWKTKVRKVDQLQTIEERAMTKEEELLKHIGEQTSNIKESITTIQRQKNIPNSAEVKAIAEKEKVKQQQEAKQISTQNLKLEKLMQTLESKKANDEKGQLKSIVELEQLEKMKLATLRAKDQENRLLKLKLKEL